PRSEGILAAYMNPTSAVGQVAMTSLAGEIEAERGNLDKAIKLLSEAVELEMNLVYQEPSAWHYPVRHALGAVLLQAGKAAEAEVVYRADLEKHRVNGWSLFGLYQSLIDQGEVKKAKKVRSKFEDVWQHADVALTASRF
ncbi:MAG: tetratricopeptide repeat protein, partial [Saprospiraceae bacterium]|nr:tetratricopeptide repeat protein [Saprospiraceae bacterium]